jgi:hypothetical protein
VDALAQGGRDATLRGYRRRWGVAMDNRVDLPGYKYYVDAASGDRPAVYVAFVDLEPDPDALVEGVVFPVDEAALAALDSRERNYVRADVTGGIYPPTGGRVDAYFGSVDARARYSAGPTVIARDYLLAGGASTRDAPVPIKDLRRVDLAKKAPRP